MAGEGGLPEWHPSGQWEFEGRHARPGLGGSGSLGAVVPVVVDVDRSCDAADNERDPSCHQIEPGEQMGLRVGKDLESPTYLSSFQTFSTLFSLLSQAPTWQLCWVPPRDSPEW